MQIWTFFSVTFVFVSLVSEKGGSGPSRLSGSSSSSDSGSSSSSGSTSDSSDSDWTLFIYFFIFKKKTLYAVKVISPLRLFIRKETIKMHHVRTFFLLEMSWRKLQITKQTNKLLFISTDSERDVQMSIFNERKPWSILYSSSSLLWRPGNVVCCHCKLKPSHLTRECGKQKAHILLSWVHFCTSLLYLLVFLFLLWPHIFPIGRCAIIDFIFLFFVPCIVVLS